MGKDTAISWTHHTFNPWWGCEKVSPACAHCYAETFAKRIGHFTDSPSGKPPLWGAKSERRFFGDKHWNDPLKWDRELSCQCPGCDTVFSPPRGGFPNAPTCFECDMVATYLRPRVFCASMADVFEDREDLIPHRARLFDLIRRTPNLDWLLLTKRPENWKRQIISAHKSLAGTSEDIPLSSMLVDWVAGTPPANIWLGTTVENQEMADKRIPELLKIPARVRFLSCEPLLGPVDLALPAYAPPMPSLAGTIHRRPDWVICGGESGASARPMHPSWARSLRDQCAAANVPFHFKQHGEWLALDMTEQNDPVRLIKAEQRYVSYDGQIHSVNSAPCSSYLVSRVGTARAGRLLDGVLHDAFPVINP